MGNKRLLILALLVPSVIIEAVGAWGYSWSSWDTGTRDVWDWAVWEIADCARAMWSHLGSNFRLFIWPSVPSPFGMVQVFPAGDWIGYILAAAFLVVVWGIFIGTGVRLVVERLESDDSESL